MRSLLVLPFVVAVAWASCEVCISNKCYDKLDLFRFPVSGQLAMDQNRNIVYFYYETQTNSFNIVLDLTYLDFQINYDLGYTFAKTVDQQSRMLYIGGFNGILTFDRSTTETKPFGLFNETIWHMFYEKKLYYVDFVNYKLYSYMDKAEKIVDLNSSVHEFSVARNDTVFFVAVDENNIYRTYALDKDTATPRIVSNSIYIINTDTNGDPFFVSPFNRGIYNKNLDKIGSIDSGTPTKFVFDKDNNIVYYDYDVKQLYYLRASGINWQCGRKCEL